jgi:hypothetical protein
VTTAGTASGGDGGRAVLAHRGHGLPTGGEREQWNRKQNCERSTQHRSHRRDGWSARVFASWAGGVRPPSRIQRYSANLYAGLQRTGRGRPAAPLRSVYRPAGVTAMRPPAVDRAPRAR